MGEGKGGKLVKGEIQSKPHLRSWRPQREGNARGLAKERGKSLQM